MGLYNDLVLLTRALCVHGVMVRAIPSLPWLFTHSANNLPVEDSWLRQSIKLSS